MPGPLLHLGATVVCAHSGQGIPDVTDPRVTLSGQPAVTIDSPYTIAGCPFPPVSGGPCVSGVFLVPATRVLIDGSPALLLSSEGVCAPTGVPLIAISAQPRVVGM
jgi:hypothetical protein